MRKGRSTTNRGFSLVESILAISVFSLFVFTIATTHLYGLETSVSAGNRARATLLAEEGLEVARTLRNANFETLVAGEHGLSFSGDAWSLSGSEDVVGMFTRSITISNHSATTKEIISTVSWSESSGRDGSVSLATRLTNWETP
jgi:prepilin-type N-terminal cleavage/methylation domain-containing protein